MTEEQVRSILHGRRLAAKLEENERAVLAVIRERAERGFVAQLTVGPYTLTEKGFSLAVSQGDVVDVGQSLLPFATTEEEAEVFVAPPLPARQQEGLEAPATFEESILAQRAALVARDREEARRADAETPNLCQDLPPARTRKGQFLLFG